MKNAVEKGSSCRSPLEVNGTFLKKYSIVYVSSAVTKFSKLSYITTW